MKIRLLFLTALLFVFSKEEIQGQIYHEIGGFVGPVALYSDYGQRNDFDTNMGNTGIGLGVVHYLNFSYGGRSSFNQHFMVRNEFAFHTTSLKHYGQWVSPEKTSLGAKQLRAMKGSTTVFEVGSHLEYYPRDLREFSYGGYKLGPFASLGLNVVFFNPKASSSLGPLNTEETTPPKYMNAFKEGMGVSFAIVGAVGTRYKVADGHDISVSARWHYYFSDWIDGLNPRLENNRVVRVPENKSNDWLFWLSVGYIYYLD